ncbi:MAG: hypothetical protein M0R46_09460 [Candidatus Muirbacterium halophilum]|nr:hypothetical protein [Candidatus Muirbacterium halophilum]
MKKIILIIILIFFVFFQIMLISILNDFLQNSISNKVVFNDLSFFISVFFIYSFVMNLAFILLLINIFIKIKELEKIGKNSIGS